MAERNMGLHDPVEMSAEHSKCTHLNCTALKCTNGSMSSGTQLTCTCKVAAHQHGATHKQFLFTREARSVLFNVL